LQFKELAKGTDYFYGTIIKSLSESAGKDFDPNDDDDSLDIDNNFEKADPKPEQTATLIQKKSKEFKIRYY